MLPFFEVLVTRVSHCVSGGGGGNCSQISLESMNYDHIFVYTCISSQTAFYRMLPILPVFSLSIHYTTNPVFYIPPSKRDQRMYIYLNYFRLVKERENANEWYSLEVSVCEIYLGHIKDLLASPDKVMPI